MTSGRELSRGQQQCELAGSTDSNQPWSRCTGQDWVYEGNT